jgi:pimeloyl-ACP methyl ester carboxylesterase
MFLHGFGLGFASPVLFAYLSCAPPTSLLAEFEYANVGGPIAETVPTTRAVAKALAVALSEAGFSEKIDVIGHSYGSAVASALRREGRARRVALLDPICFLERASNMAPFVMLDPWESGWQRSVGHGGMQYFLWYWIFRDLGLATICARGLLGEEYMDRDEFRDADDVMVVLGEKDRIVPADSLYQSFVQEEAFGKGNRLIWLPGAMHGESGLRLAVAAEIDAFFCA